METITWAVIEALDEGQDVAGWTELSRVQVSTHRRGHRECLTLFRAVDKKLFNVFIDVRCGGFGTAHYRSDDELVLHPVVADIACT